MSLTLTISSGAIDFFAAQTERSCSADLDTLQVNEFYIEQSFTGKAKEFLLKARDIINNGNHNNSDYMTDYFNVGWYTHITIGKWDKPYLLAA